MDTTNENFLLWLAAFQASLLVVPAVITTFNIVWREWSEKHSRRVIELRPRRRRPFMNRGLRPQPV